MSNSSTINNNAADVIALVQGNAKVLAKCGENLIKGCQENTHEAIKGAQATATLVLEAGQEAAKSVASATQEFSSVKSLNDLVRIQTRIGQAVFNFGQTALERGITDNSKLVENCLRTFQQVCAPLTHTA